MAEARVEMSVRDAGAGVRVIDISGEVTAFAEPILAEAFGQASAGGARVVALNFAGMEYMNSGGIGLLVTMLVRTQRAGQRLLAAGLSEHYCQILSLTRLDEAIAIHDTADAALAATA